MAVVYFTVSRLIEMVEAGVDCCMVGPLEPWFSSVVRHRCEKLTTAVMTGGAAELMAISTAVIVEDEQKEFSVVGTGAA